MSKKTKKEPVYRYKKVKFNKESNIEKININNKYLNNSCKYTLIKYILILL